MAGEFPGIDSIAKLADFIKQTIGGLSHDVQNLQGEVRTIQGRLTSLAERADIAKLENQIDRLGAEKLLLVRKEEFSDVKNQIAVLSLDQEFIQGIKGTLGMIKVVVGATGGLIVMLVGAAIALHQQDMVGVNDSAARLNKFEAKVDYVVGHQIADLLEFKREVEETGSPILRATIQDVAEVKAEMKTNRAEVRALSNVFIEAQRHRDRPDPQDTK